MRLGRRLAIDVGKSRVGLALSDLHGILASPLSTIARADFDSRPEMLSEQVPELADLLEIYVGLPLNLAGLSTPSTLDSVQFANTVANFTSAPVLLIDERLTTSMANRQVIEIGSTQKASRSIVDQMAAVAILEYALQIEKNSNSRPGVTVEEWRQGDE